MLQEIGSGDIFEGNHYYSFNNTTIVSNFKNSLISSVIRKDGWCSSWGWVENNFGLLTFSGPYVICFFENSIFLRDVLNEFAKFTTTDCFNDIDLQSALFAKYYQQYNIIYIFFKEPSNSLRLQLNVSQHNRLPLNNCNQSI